MGVGLVKRSMDIRLGRVELWPDPPVLGRISHLIRCGTGRLCYVGNGRLSSASRLLARVFLLLDECTCIVVWYVLFFGPAREGPGPPDSRPHVAFDPVCSASERKAFQSSSSCRHLFFLGSL